MITAMRRECLQGHFCPAIATAVKTMLKGEEVHLIVKPECECGGACSGGCCQSLAPLARHDTLAELMRCCSYCSLACCVSASPLMRHGGSCFSIGKMKRRPIARFYRLVCVDSHGRWDGLWGLPSFLCFSS